jgi:hypothetical protein
MNEQSTMMLRLNSGLIQPLAAPSFVVSRDPNGLNCLLRYGRKVTIQSTDPTRDRF